MPSVSHTRLPDRNPLHSQGWPHYDVHGNCLCFNKCCHGPNGCKCRGCRQKSHCHILKETKIRKWCAENKIEIPGWEANIPQEIVLRWEGIQRAARTAKDDRR